MWKEMLKDPLVISIVALIVNQLIRKIKKILKQVFKKKRTMLLLPLFLLVGCVEEKPKDLPKNQMVLVAEIVDRTPPEIIFTKNEVDIILGESNELHLEDIVFVSDNMDHNIKYQIGGSVDYGKAGEYKLQITASDTTGNTASKELLVRIKEKPIEKPTENPTETPTIPQTPTQPSQPITPSTEPITHPQVEYFLFSQGYDFDSSYSACVMKRDQVIASGGAKGGSCDPIKENGLYIGYRLTYY